jgi:hypothetical protein
VEPARSLKCWLSTSTWCHVKYWTNFKLLYFRCYEVRISVTVLTDSIPLLIQLVISHVKTKVDNATFSGTIFYYSYVGMRLLVRSPWNGPLYQSWMIDERNGASGGALTGKGNRSTRRKPAPIPLCPQQNSHELIWDWTRAAWGMARPGITLHHSVFSIPKSVHGFQPLKFLLKKYNLCLKRIKRITESIGRNCRLKWSFRIPILIFK